MSSTEEKLYSAKEIADGLARASAAWQIVEGPECEETIDDFCVIFLSGFLGKDAYRQAMTELVAEELHRSGNPAAAILAALMAGARRDSDVAGDV